MYEHFRPSERVFVDREEHLDWMSEALKRCKEKSVVLHLRGIGGIGKSSLLEYWHQTIERSIILDCSRIADLFSRLDAIAKGAVRLGIGLSRFDVLWSIRQRFVQGVEPAKEEGRGWAMDIIAPLPFIGSLTGIGTAIKAISQKISPKITGKYGSLGSWLQSRLGRDYVEELLEILWKDPRNAEFLYLDALLEDLNNRKDADTPILLVLDGFDDVDDEEPRWNYRGRKIPEAELWLVLLSSLSNSVGVVAGRKALPRKMDDSLDIEVAELRELDNASCLKLLVKRETIDEDLQQKIVDVSRGNPFILDTICDMFSLGGLSSEDVESFRADTLEEVRTKTWKKLFSQVREMEPIIERTSLIPYFDRSLLKAIVPGLKTYQWEQLIRFSFVKSREDGMWVLHDLAKDLVIAELGTQLGPLCMEVSNLLDKESESEGNLHLRGLAISVEALVSEEDAIRKARELVNDLNKRESSKAALSILGSLVLRTVEGKAEYLGMLGWALNSGTRYAESEAALKESIGVFEELVRKDFANYGPSLGVYLRILGDLYLWTSRPRESEESLLRAIELQRRLVAENNGVNLEDLAESLAEYGFVLANAMARIPEAVPLAKEAVQILKQIENTDMLPWALNVLATTQIDPRERISLYKEARELQSALTRKEPDNARQKAILAAICHNLTYPLYWEGRIKETEDLHHEVIRLRRELTDLDHNVYGWRLAMALNNYGDFLWQTRQLSKAEKPLQESAQMYEEWMQEEYGAYATNLANNLSLQVSSQIIHGNVAEAYNLAGRAKEMLDKHLETIVESPVIEVRLGLNLVRNSLILNGKTLRIGEAEKALNEGIQLIEMHKDLSSFNEVRYGEALNNGGAFYIFTNRISQSETLLEDATKILRNNRAFAVVSDNLHALSLCNLAIACRKSGALQESNSLYQESLSLFDKIVQKMPNRFQYNMTTTLSNFSILLKEMGKLEEAESSLSQAIETQRHFAEIEPQYFQPILAISLNNQGVLFSETNRLSEAKGSFNEAIQIRRKLVKQSPEMYQLGLASSLHNIGILHKKNGNSQEAEQSLKEAQRIWDQLVEKAPEVINPRLAKTLHQLRIMLLEDDSKMAEAKDIEKRLLSMKVEFSEDADSWIEEEEPLFIW